MMLHHEVHRAVTTALYVYGYIMNTVLYYMLYYDIAHFVNVRSNLAEVWSKATLMGLLCPANFSSLFRAL